MPSAPVSLRSVVFDCPDPPALATFYADLLNGQLDISDPEWCEVQVGDPSFKLAFQLATPYSPPEWPGGTPQQLHLDLTVSDLGAACLRAGELGAVVLSGPVEEPGSIWVVHADPAGHPFCLCEQRDTNFTTRPSGTT
jgi:predicted enzyme related to lactoylglutathione lyase